LPEYGATVFVYKRPYLDHFLDRVSKWYDLTVFTAGVEAYASPILDFLDRGRGILTKRLYRHDCIDVFGLRAKYVTLASPDLSNVLLLDNSSTECSFNAGNSIHIKSYQIGSRDEALIDLLPFLDALRFTKDVRSVLQRCTRFEGLTTFLESVTQWDPTNLFKFYFWFICFCVLLNFKALNQRLINLDIHRRSFCARDILIYNYWKSSLECRILKRILLNNLRVLGILKLIKEFLIGNPDKKNGFSTRN